MKIVHDVDGSPLQLLKTRMLEVTPSSARRWTVTFAEIRRAVRQKNLSIAIEARGKDQPTDSLFAFSTNRIPVEFFKDSWQIGCRKFSKYTFNKILKAAGAK